MKKTMLVLCLVLGMAILPQASAGNSSDDDGSSGSRVKSGATPIKRSSGGCSCPTGYELNTDGSHDASVDSCRRYKAFGTPGSENRITPPCPSSYPDYVKGNGKDQCEKTYTDHKKGNCGLALTKMKWRKCSWSESPYNGKWHCGKSGDHGCEAHKAHSCEGSGWSAVKSEGEADPYEYAESETKGCQMQKTDKKDINECTAGYSLEKDLIGDQDYCVDDKVSCS
jgi:hypothetical protein